MTIHFIWMMLLTYKKIEELQFSVRDKYCKFDCNCFMYHLIGWDQAHEKRGRLPKKIDYTHHKYLLIGIIVMYRYSALAHQLTQLKTVLHILCTRSSNLSSDVRFVWTWIIYKYLAYTTGGRTWSVSTHEREVSDMEIKIVLVVNDIKLLSVVSLIWSSAGYICPRLKSWLFMTNSSSMYL